MRELQNDETKAIQLRNSFVVVFAVSVLFVVLFALWQILQRSIKGGGPVHLRPIFCAAMVGVILPWGLLVAYLGVTRLRLLMWGAFVFNAVAWLAAFFVFAVALISTVNGDVGFRAMMQILGTVVSLMLFGLLQFAGWLPGIPRGERSRALKLLLVFPTLLGLIVLYGHLLFQRYLDASFSPGTSGLIIVAATFGSAAILTACILAHYLMRGLEEQPLATAVRMLDQPGMFANTDADTQSK